MDSSEKEEEQKKRQKILFETLINRMHSHCLKYDAISIFFPEYPNPEFVSCNWVGDMDFNVCPHITEGILKRIKANNIYGYPGLLIKNEPFLNSITNWCMRRKVVVNELILQEGSYQIDFENLENRLSDPNNKIMVFCNPHNPSGRAWTPQEVEKISTLCLKYQVYLISDEIFADLTFPDSQHTIAGSLSNEINENTATIFTPSKAFNLSGLSISTVVIPDKQLHKQFTDKNNSQGFYYANIFGQIAFEHAYSLEGEQWLNDLNNYIVKNYNYMVQYFKQEYPNIQVMNMQAGYLAVLDFTQTNISYGKIKQILVNSNVLLEDLSDFFYPKKETQLFRINIACPLTKLKECLNKIIIGFKQKKQQI